MLLHQTSDAIRGNGTSITLDEYLPTMYEPDCIIGDSVQSATQVIVASLLYNRRGEFRIHVFPSLRVQVGATRVRIPDVLVTTQKVRGRILREPPFLCIEILSPEDRVSRMGKKIDDYLAFGVKYVWLIDPEDKSAWVYTAERKREPVRVLTTAEPMISLPLDELFAALDEEVEP
jgi:Uma2 family endonuclease